MQESVSYAGLMRRILALIIDFVVLSAVFFPVTRMVKGVWIMSASEHQWDYGWFITDPLCIIFLAVIVLYFILLEGAIGATVGKMALGMHVVDLHGNRPGLLRSLVRNVMRAVDALPVFSILGMVLIVTSKECARLGDRVAGTRVILQSSENRRK